MKQSPYMDHVYKRNSQEKASSRRGDLRWTIRKDRTKSEVHLKTGKSRIKGNEDRVKTPRSERKGDTANAMPYN